MRIPALTTFTAMSAIAALALAGCAGGGDTPSAPRATTATSSAPSAAPSASPTVEEQPPAVPVGASFETASWSVKTRSDALVLVTADRLITDGPVRDGDRTITAWSSDGEQVWSHKISEGVTDIRALSKTVAFVESREVKGTGLDKTRLGIVVTLLSLDDGEIVAEVEMPDATIGQHGLTFTVKSPEWGSTGSDGFILVNEDGTTREIDPGYVDDVDAVAGIPVWSDTSELQTESWNARELGLGMSSIMVIDPGQGLLLLQDTSGRGDADTFSMVQAETGAILYTVSCPTNQYGMGASGASGKTPAVNSPNGQYSVAGSLAFSATESRCVGGGDQQKVTLTAVDDDGTAYGETEDGQLVVVALGGEPQVSELPANAHSPIGVMTGDIAVHRDESTGVVTGNHIMSK